MIESREEQVPEELTAQPDSAEPAGDQDPAAEKEYDEAKEEAAAEAVVSAAPAPDAAEAAHDAAAEVAKYLELAQRTQAELENLRKRAARDVAQAGQRAKANLVRELLPVVDNLERALATANPEEDHLAEGVRLVHVELVNTLERNGIKAFDPAGEPFDPNVHEAISMRESDNGSGIVLDVVEKGYKLGDSVIRPARVVVSS
ncbi:MAG TPA: nucleotide exchange factor GrpE [Thermoleophilaceae bacterium]|nr:nucleotide exchange factor GrpE [Thermoleophilaceae bacterium]